MNKAVNILLFAVLLLAAQAADAQWVKQRVSTFAWLRDVYFLSDTTGWIVGSDGTMLTTSDGGDTWKATPKFTTDTFLKIRFTDQNTGWLLCERNVYARGQNATSYLRKTTDGGRTWERIEFADGGRERVTAIMFTRDGRGTAFGEGGFFYDLDQDGRTWKKSRSAIRYLLLGGSFSDGPSGAIAGAGGTLLFTQDSGRTWDNATLSGSSAPRFNSVFLVSQRTGWAVGSAGAVYTTTGGGRTWRPQASGTTADLTDVYFSGLRNGWAVGAGGTIIRTVNGGQNWSTVTSNVTHRLERITFNGNRGWAVGFGGTILSYGATPTQDRPTLRPRN